MRPLRSLLCALVLACGVGVTAAPSVSAQARPADIELVKGLRAGSHVILFRHVEADPDGFDRDPRNFKATKQQQQLTERGRGQAKLLGQWLRSIRVPVGEVVSSRFFRSTQMASLAGLGTIRPTDDVTEGSLIASPNENRRRARALRALIGSPTQPNQNRMIITHRVNIQHALGKEWFEVKEGEASIFRVDGGSYSLIVRLPIDEWPRLVAAAEEIDRQALDRPALDRQAPATPPQ